MIKIHFSVLLATLLLLVSATGYAGMRCDNDLVLEGDNFDEVRNTCGDADAEYDMGTRVVYREVFHGREKLGVAESIKVDMWVYRRDNNSFARELYFENGILVKIELGSRGK